MAAKQEISQFLIRKTTNYHYKLYLVVIYSLLGLISLWKGLGINVETETIQTETEIICNFHMEAP